MNTVENQESLAETSTGQTNNSRACHNRRTHIAGASIFLIILIIIVIAAVIAAKLFSSDFDTSVDVGLMFSNNTNNITNSATKSVTLTDDKTNIERFPTSSATIEKPTTNALIPNDFHPSTERPLPPNPANISAITLLYQIGTHPEFLEMACETVHPPVFKWNVTIEEHIWTGDSNSKQNAKEAAARNSTTDMFGIDYSSSRKIPVPASPCKLV